MFIKNDKLKSLRCLILGQTKCKTGKANFVKDIQKVIVFVAYLVKAFKLKVCFHFELTGLFFKLPKVI